MTNMIEFPKPQKDGIDLFFQGISAGMIPVNTPEDEAFDELFDEIETLFYAVSTNQLPHNEAADILIGRIAGAIIFQTQEP